MRLEKDCIGELPVPDNALYGIHSLRAVRNFPITEERVNPVMIESYLQIKKAAAMANVEAKTLDKQKGAFIIAAINQLLFSKDYRAVIVPAIQGGAGTSTNMNINEVVAHLASRISDQKSGQPMTIHPNDDVNQSQSTNDTYPTAGKMSILKLVSPLERALTELISALDTKATVYRDAIKVGRTQLQDAVPTTFGRSFRAYRSLFRRDLTRIKNAKTTLATINLGGTAIGTGINTTKTYQQRVVPILNQLTPLSLTAAGDLVDATQNGDAYVTFSGILKTLAVDLSKFSNDLRLLSSGPQAGLNELQLPKVQAGSSIMPGKVNPVIPEVVNQVAFEVIGHDTTVTMAAEAGQLELNAFEPIMFKSILTSETHLAKAIKTLVTNCINGITANVDGCRDAVEQSTISATVLSPYLGYEKTTSLIKEAEAKHLSVSRLVKSRHLLADDLIDHLFSPACLTHEAPTDKMSGNLTATARR